MVILTCILLVLILINLILCVFMSIVLVRILEAIMHLGRTKPTPKPDPRTRSGLPPGLVDVGGATNYDVHGNPSDTHNLQDQTVRR